jgi:hypothetical protein
MDANSTPTDLLAKLEDAVARYKAMTPAEKEAMHEAQRNSWIRGELGMGSDADEAAYTHALARNDFKRLAELNAEADARVAAFDASLRARALMGGKP